MHDIAKLRLTWSRICLTTSAAIGVAFLLIVGGEPSNASGVYRADAPPSVSSGAPPLVVCGRTLWHGADGAVMLNATKHAVHVSQTSAGGRIYIRFTSYCGHGANLNFPYKDTGFVRFARARNGKIVAAAFEPQAKKFIISRVEDGRVYKRVYVDLGS